jgi:hypothetical protein
MLLVHWLSLHTDLRGVVKNSSAYWGWSLKGKVQFARKRLKRVGLLKTCDESLYYILIHRKFLGSVGNAEDQSKLIDLYTSKYGSPNWQGDSLQADSVNSPAVLEFVRQRQPDLIMSMCVNDFFGRTLREIPRLGCFLWHEGITPEYKGLYSPFWAIHNIEPNMLGYTVLRMNHRYDDGEVFVQGPATDVDPRADSASFIGHKAVLDSLPAVKELLQKLEQGTATPISTANRKSTSYTYPGLSDGLRFAARLKRMKAGVAQRETVEHFPLEKRLIDTDKG